MLSNYGPEWKRLFRPVHLLLRDAPLSFYVGEMLVSAVVRPVIQGAPRRGRP
jgi:hypothetical protein